MNTRLARAFTQLSILLLLGGLSACGGGGTGSSASLGGGIGGTGVTAAGTITALGSISVNGVRYDTSSAAITVDGKIATENDLKLGMFVTVKGTVDSSGISGTANSVDFDDNVQGPVTGLDPATAGNPTRTFTVLGMTVVTDKVSTVFEGSSISTLADGDLVEASGLIDNTGKLQATRIEKKSSFFPDSSEVEVKGTVSSLNNNTFTLGSLAVTTAGGVDLSAIQNGSRVEVKGTLDAAQTNIFATSVKLEDSLFDSTASKVSLEGIVSNFVSNSSFDVSAQPVDASSASFEPAGQTLVDGLEVEVEGSVVNGTLIATKVELHDDTVELEARVSSVDQAANRITLQFATGTVSFLVNNKTSIRDDATGNSLTLNNISATDFLEVEGFIDSAGNVVANEVKRDQPDDDVIQGPVQSLDATSGDITLLGLTFGTDAATSFKPSPSSSFFATASPNTIVKIKDKNRDGVAEEAKIEN